MTGHKCENSLSKGVPLKLFFYRLVISKKKMDIPQACITTTGLILDLFGVLLIGYEIFRQYDGDEYQPSAGLTPGEDGYIHSHSEVQPTPEYKKWVKNRSFAMKVGIGFVVTGFMLQIVGSWWSYL